MKQKPRWLFSLELLALFGVYFATAKFGLELGAVSGFATLVWPPTGIALTAMLFLGYRVWPAIFLGAFLTNLTTGAPILTACGMGAGNTLEAVLGVYLLRRFEFSPRLDRLRDVFCLIFFAAILSTAVSASIGTLSLFFSGVVPAHNFGATWRAWWLGDALGDLVVTPMLLVWAGRQWPRRAPGQLIEFGLVVLGLIVTSLIIFGQFAILPSDHPPITYIIFPIILWAALRSGMFGAVNATFLLSIFTVWSTAKGYGPFARNTLSESLFYLVTFQSVVAVTGMIFAAIMQERRQALDELYRHQEELRGALQTRDEFLSIASHELKTPVTSLLLQLQLLGKNLRKSFSPAMGEAPAPEKLFHALEICEKQSKRLVVLLDELLDLTRIRAGRLSLTIEEIRLSSIVQDAVERQKEAALKAGSSLNVRADASIVGEWDRMRLEQIVTNLLSNAIKYGAGKPIEIVVEEDKARKCAVLKVKDRGIGISSDLRSKVFEPYERAITKEGKNISGLGLGLYITRQIVEAHGGEIDFQSELGVGSTFTVIFPLKHSGGAAVERAVGE